MHQWGSLEAWGSDHTFQLSAVPFQELEEYIWVIIQVHKVVQGTLAYDTQASVTGIPSSHQKGATSMQMHPSKSRVQTGTASTPLSLPTGQDIPEYLIY